ncbi:ABC transporter substrate-binding protein [Deinococcus cellulosilyticus]|uniref:ABC transporter substrate-binding protein n=1 Tax=Deinococcus cellulosilyticus (strain DSM 18568 / NBRC 106333 / KACC 11606 / 5516J-15) TaxID=1223518 RepID=A0A511NAK4_DEIC1|nr:ABC transporter substrate-binding protein [Deinococcus cellulosilyticus]GEM49865.1 ABC transporter substrate-binding protein [Deinococcus cellulosilyticus NBRC 106333 = KACC 11606]
MRKAVLLALGLLSCAAVAAPLKIKFWHSMETSKPQVQALADEFNKSQDDYQIIPEVAGDYRTAETKLIAALRSDSAPVLFQAEISFFSKLAADGSLADLSYLEKTLDDKFIKDFYSSVWNYGEVNGKRVGLPWNVSTPVLYYNATALEARNIKPPKTWDELEEVSKKLTNRASRGFMVMAESWQFEQMVLARGGNVVTSDGKPNFTSPEVIDALEQLSRMVKNKVATPRNLGETQVAILDFVRTKNFMVVASSANYPDILPYSVAFKLGVAPMPCDKKCAVPLGGAQLVVLKGASRKEQEGAFAFWKYLMEPQTLKKWIEFSYYLTPRKSVLPLLKDFYGENPYRKTAYNQLDESVTRPKVPAYTLWRTYLEEAIEKATKGNVPARAALEEAQRKALSSK